MDIGGCLIAYFKFGFALMLALFVMGCLDCLSTPFGQ